MNKISIDTRMKDFYEVRNRRYLTRRTPVIIRIDGQAFHTYTRVLDKPFDAGLVEDMQQTMIYLCQNIQGCKFGYHQSDEISLLLTDYDTLQTDAWFDYCQNKIESIAASMATAEFNRLRIIRTLKEIFVDYNCGSEDNPDIRINKPNLLERFMPAMAKFDARAFNIPTEEVANYFIWRQQDATKNSISMVAQSLYSHTELHGKNKNQMQEMIHQKGLNWNNFPTNQRRGSACYQKPTEKHLTGKVPLKRLKNQKNAIVWDDGIGNYGVYTNEWQLDLEIPIFSRSRDLIKALI